MKSLANLLESKTIAVVQNNRRIRQVISQIVPASTLEHLLFFRIEHGRLHITVDNAVWITQLRFSERQLLAELQGHKDKVYTVRWHVAPAEAAQSRITRRRANEASGYAAEQVAALAQQIAADEGGTALDSGEIRPADASAAEATPEFTQDVVADQDDRLGQALERLARNLKKS